MVETGLNTDLKTQKQGRKECFLMGTNKESRKRMKEAKNG